VIVTQSLVIASQAGTGYQGVPPHRLVLTANSIKATCYGTVSSRHLSRMSKLIQNGLDFQRLTFTNPPSRMLSCSTPSFFLDASTSLGIPIASSGLRPHVDVYDRYGSAAGPVLERYCIDASSRPNPAAETQVKAV
jgi:hypothetical protein